MITRLFRLILVLSFILLIIEFSYAHVEITNPEGGETFYTNDTILITWVEAQAHDTQNWELYYSSDGGDSWTTISLNIPVPLREFEWIIPKEITNKGRIRVVQNNAETDYDDVSANFSIENATGTFETKEQKFAFASFKNYPNPCSYHTSFSFTLLRQDQITLKIYHLNGSLLETVVDDVFEVGQHTINWGSESLDADLYVYTFRIGDAIRTKKLQMIK